MKNLKNLEIIFAEITYRPDLANNPDSLRLIQIICENPKNLEIFELEPVLKFLELVLTSRCQKSAARLILPKILDQEKIEKSLLKVLLFTISHLDNIEFGDFDKIIKFAKSFDQNLEVGFWQISNSFIFFTKFQIFTELLLLTIFRFLSIFMHDL